MSPQSKIFDCRRCGYCCQGETTVSLDMDDLERMAAYLRLPAEEVKKRYLRVNNGVVQMQTVAGHCIFYEGGCTIHEGKPWRCRQWPLHPSMTADPANFETIRSSCPGIKGEMGYDEFKRILTEVLPLVTPEGKPGRG